MTGLDPLKWIGRYLPDLWIHRIVRVFLLGIFFLFLVKRIGEYPFYFFKPLWVMETLIFVVFIISLATRINPRVHSRGWKEIVLPGVASALPFLFLTSQPYGPFRADPEKLYLIFGFMTVTTFFTIWALWYLRRSFSITAEVRELVTKGPYRWVRHPMYLGEILTAGAVCIWRFSLSNLLLFTAFVTLQLLRSRVEERKLFQFFQEEYAAFASSRWWFLNF
ncbi:MAG: isoprenylcysteine carboxylmethyltransferase family protein [Synergistales bacterium]|nr:isoprenylcysteine carboxylmethyltransferase family protein [Synergistales bacterium]